MTEQEFCLRWNNHESNLSAVLELMLKKEALVDVTFACDGQLLKAHRTVLSACSPYFESMFMGTAHPHPIVILRDVRAEEFRSLIDFMYKGEVTVCQSQLSSFLRIAESLQVRGLTEKDKSATDADAVIQTDIVPDPQASPPGSPSGKDSNHRKKRRKRPEPQFPDNSATNTFQPPIPQTGPCTNNTTSTPPNLNAYPVLASTSYNLVGTPSLESLLPLQEAKNSASSVSLVDSLSQYSYVSDPGTSHCANVKQEPSLASAIPTLVDMASDDTDAFNFGASSAASFLESALQLGGSGVCINVSDDSSSTAQEHLELSRETEMPAGEQSGSTVSFPLQQLRGSHITLQSSFKPVLDNPTKWLCRICHREVAHRRPHLLTHLPKSIRCRLCPQESSRPDNMRNHIKNKHPEVMMLHGEDFKTSLFADFFHNGLKKAKRKRKRT